MSTPGDCYEQKRQEAQAAAEALRQAVEVGANYETIRRLERELDFARYTGD